MQCQVFRWTVLAFPRLAKSLNLWYSTPFLRNPVTKFLIISTHKKSFWRINHKDCTVFHTLTIPRFEGFDFKNPAEFLGKDFGAQPWHLLGVLQNVDRHPIWHPLPRTPHTHLIQLGPRDGPTELATLHRPKCADPSSRRHHSSYNHEPTR